MNHIRTILMSVAALSIVLSSHAAIINWDDIEIKEWVTNVPAYFNLIFCVKERR